MSISTALETNGIPGSVTRFETGKRPELFSHRGLGDGRNGAISVRKPSAMIGMRIARDSVVLASDVSSTS